jgi:hypothetical protein
VYLPERGTNLLDLLQQLTSGQTAVFNRGPVHCEWQMVKGFQLHVRSQLGVPRPQVVYHEGSTALAALGDEYDRTEIANLIAVESQKYVYRVATHAISRAKWGQRELYTRIEGNYADKIHQQIADTQRDTYHDESLTSTLSIVPGPYRTPFRDFGLGDVIGVARAQGRKPSTIDKHRVMAITVTVDAAGRAAYELTLASTRTTRTAWLKIQVDALLSVRKKGITAFIQDDEPGGGQPGDLWTPEQTFHAS